MCDFDNLFDAAIAEADGIIIDTMARGVQIEIAGAMMPVEAVFDSPPADYRIRNRGGVIHDVAPTIFTKTAQVLGVREKAAVDVGGEHYWVKKIDPDDCGTTLITLARGKPGQTAATIGEWSKK